nr:putative reverse transcriptase domain-containing protein [Tanacetum cinerariifolium]
TEGIQREQGRRIVGVESAVIALIERVAKLERDNQRLRDTASVESENGGNENGGNEGNGNGDNGGNGNKGNGNHGMNYGGFVPMVRECTFQDFLKCKLHTFSRTEGVVGLTRRKPLEFQVGDKVMLKVSPWKGVIRFGKRGKLNPRYIGPFKILAKVGTVAYRLELPEQLSKVYSTFHVSKLKKYMADEPLAIPLDEIQVDNKLNFIEEPVEIMDREVKRLKQSRILIVKVRWNSKRGPEFTWEREDQMQKKYPHLFPNTAPMTDTTS